MGWYKITIDKEWLTYIKICMWIVVCLCWRTQTKPEPLKIPNSKSCKWEWWTGGGLFSFFHFSFRGWKVCKFPHSKFMNAILELMYIYCFMKTDIFFKGTCPELAVHWIERDNILSLHFEVVVILTIGWEQQVALQANAEMQMEMMNWRKVKISRTPLIALDRTWFVED